MFLFHLVDTGLILTIIMLPQTQTTTRTSDDDQNLRHHLPNPDRRNGAGYGAHHPTMRVTVGALILIASRRPRVAPTLPGSQPPSLLSLVERPLATPARIGSQMACRMTP
ncbi:hypothetical protein C8Q73DRAFT_259891 [Cubamyces lactineus]|nr:hypothetical protein C8Q73DRAFT_259891 [Cubamyces lactineus]